MRLALFLIGVAAFAQPTVSDISTVRVTHSTVTLKYRTSSVGAYTRVRYGLTTSYEAEGGCAPLLECGIQTYNGDDANADDVVELRVGGLQPDTEYHFCPQVSTNNSLWSTCVDHTATTAALEAGDHPAYPIAPTAVDTARPDTAGYTTRAVAANCSDLQSKIDAAASNQTTAGSIITIPAGTVCTGQYTLKAPGGMVKTFTSANVTTSTSRITVTGHGLNDNDMVKMLANVPPASAGPDTFRQHRGFPIGNTYYARVHDENTISLAATSGGAALPFTVGTFTIDAGDDTLIFTTERHVPLDGTPVQVVTTDTLPTPLSADTTYYVVNRDQANRTIQLEASIGGGALDLSGGAGTHSLADRGDGGALMKWPPTSNWIIIRTASTDAQFVPEGVRVTPEFVSKMATIRTSNRSAVALNADDGATNYRIEGIEFTHTDTATEDIATTINPQYFLGLIWIQRAVSNVILDRCYIHGLGFPNRLYRAITDFHAANSAIMNSYLEKLDAWSPVREGMALTRNSDTEFTVATGTWHFGAGSQSIGSTVTVTTSGSADGTKTGLVYLTLAGALTLRLPTGVSASCVPDVCTVANEATPAWPVNGDSRTAVMPIGNLSFTDAALTAVSAEALDPDNGHIAFWEGAAPFMAGDIAGRTALINNYLSTSGSPSFIYDDSNGNQGPTGTDYTVTRNHFVVPPERAFSRAESDGLRYGQRQQLEWKNGKRIKIRGNVFEGVFADSTPVAAAISISGTPGPNAAITDVEIGYNLFRNGSGGIAIGGGRIQTDNGDTRPPAAPLQRVWVHNNLVHNLDQYAHRAYAGNNWLNPAVDARGLFEDFRVEHNTFYDLRGTGPALMVLSGQFEGLRVADNVFWLNDALVFRATLCNENVPACADDGLALLADLGNGSVWTNNSVIAGWTDETGETARSSKTYITSALTSGTDAYLQSEMTGAIDWHGAAAGNFRIGPNATNQSGGAKNASDGKARGVDMDQLEREIGTIHVADALSIAVSTAVIPFRAPDRGASCTVLYGTGADPAAWTGRSTPSTADDYARSVTLSGLSAATEYRFRVGCAGTAMSETRGFRTL